MGQTMHEVTQRKLLELRERQSCALSTFGKTALVEIQSLLASKVVEIGRSGAGEALHVNNIDALDQFILTHFPESDTDPTLPDRAAAIRSLRNAKQAKRRTTCIMHMRAWHPLDCQINNASYNLVAQTERCGVVSVLLDGVRQIAMKGRIALIENLECFLHAERMQLHVDAAIYTAGKLSGICLEQLASEAMAHCSYLHCPDYDPVGLAEFVRYQKRLHQRIQLHVPHNLQSLLQTYGKPALLQGRNGQIMQILRRTAPPELHKILQWMDQANAGLEQEILIR